MSQPAQPGALSGVRVFDLTSVVMGPLATQILGDLGADVITFESSRGDTNRRMGPGPTRDMSDVSLNLLRNKRNIALDLKDPAGRRAALAVATTCDVFVTNLRPGPLQRLGLSYDDVRSVRGDVVYCRASGFASDDARADEPAYDDIIQGAGGVTDVVARANGTASFMPTLIADKVSGLTLCYGILAALFHRERSGEGQLVEVPMLDAVEAFLMVEHSAGAFSGPPGQAGYQRILTSERRPQSTLDGRMVVFPYLPHHWTALLGEIDEGDVASDPRLAPGAPPDPNFIYGLLTRILVTKTTAEWLAFCRARSIPASVAPTIEEIIDQWPEVTHPSAGSYHSSPAPTRFSVTPTHLRRFAPHVGQHNREILLEAGMSASEIDELEHRGVLRSTT